MTLIIALALIGLALIYLEFFFPSGISAVVAAALLITSVTLFSMQGYGGFWITLYTIAILGAIVVSCLHALKQVRRKVALQHDQEGYQAGAFDAALVGKKGKALTELKPSGHILIEGRQLQAFSETGPIGKDQPVKIVGGRGGQYIVKKTD